MTFSGHDANALERGYNLRLEVAVLVALALHAAVLVLAPPYVPRPYRLDASPLRLVAAGGSGAAGGDASVAPGRAAEAPRPVVDPAARRGPAVLTEQLRLETQATPEKPIGNAERRGRGADSQSDGGAGAGGSGAGGTGSGAGSGAGDETPSVFYAFDSPPQVLARVVPEYSVAAMAQVAEGTVVLNANVDPGGRVVRVWVAQSTAPEILVQSAVDALYHFRFSPGSQQGIPVMCTVAVPFNFRLNVHL